MSKFLLGACVLLLFGPFVHQIATRSDSKSEDRRGIDRQTDVEDLAIIKVLKTTRRDPDFFAAVIFLDSWSSMPQSGLGSALPCINSNPVYPLQSSLFCHLPIVSLVQGWDVSMPSVGSLHPRSPTVSRIF